MDVASATDRGIARLAYVVLTQFARGAPLARNPVVLASLEQFVVNQPLLSHAHNCGAIYDTRSAVAPRDVKRAIDHTESNLTAPVGLPDIVAVADVPVRTLLKHFEDFAAFPRWKTCARRGSRR
jgi:hypothetical protein